MTPVLSTGDAAKELGCTPSTIRRLIEEGELAAQCVGGRYIVKPDNLDVLKEANDPRILRQSDRDFRVLLTKHDGNLDIVAMMLGVTASALSHRLHTERHGVWWAAFTCERSRRRRREAGRRYRAKRKKIYDSSL